MKDLNKEQSVFLSSIIHDLRSPLNGIVSVTELLKSNLDRSEQKKLLDIQKRSSEMLLDYIDNLLYFLKIENSQMVKERVRGDLKDLFENIVLINEVKAKIKGTQLSLHYSNNIPNDLIFEKMKINQITSNLVVNALKFTDEGKVSIDVGISNQTKRKLFIEITVKDDGIGMTESTISGIFKRFNQGEDITNQFGGFGIGLYTVKKLVNYMKGEITVDSELGEGTTFKVILPVIKPSKSGEQIITDDDRTLIADEVISKDILENAWNVLLVDDSFDNHYIIKTYFRDTKISITSALNVTEALQILKENNNDFDLIISDIEMPAISGTSLIKEIRNKEKKNNLKRIPAIAFSANTFKEQVDSYYEAGFDNFLSKPVKRSTLKDILFRTLAHNNKP